MSKTEKALCWGAVLIVLALMRRVGWIGADSARTLFIVLPVVAWLSLGGRPCGVCRRGKSA